LYFSISTIEKGFISTVGILCNFAYLASLPDNSSYFYVYIFFILHGIFSSIFITAFWPCIKYVISNSLTATAYGIAFSFNELVYFVAPLVTGLVIDKTKMNKGGYFWSTLVFFLWAFIAMNIAASILVSDYRNSAVLYKGFEQIEEGNESNSQRESMKDEAKNSLSNTL